jgi:hypothetical protein
MKKANTKKILSALTSKKNYAQTLEDLKYNLSTFLNEDIYLSQIEKYGTESLIVVTLLLKFNVILIAEKDERVVLTPTGENLLVELNNLLLSEV